MDLLGLHLRLAQLRERRGLSKRELARLADLNRSSVARLETPEVSEIVYLHTVTAVSSTLRVFPSDLLWPWEDKPPTVRFRRKERFDETAFRRSLCRALRAEREKLGIGPTEAARIGTVERAWLYRLEGGEYDFLNLVLLDRYTGELGIPLLENVFRPAEQVALETRHGRQEAHRADASAAAP